MIRCVPRIEVSAVRSSSRVTPCRRRRSATAPGSDAMARRKCSAERYSSRKASASESARLKRGSIRGERPRLTAPDTRGKEPRRESASDRRRGAGTPARAKSSPATPPSCRRKATKRCSGSTCACPASEERRTASCSASWDFTVSLSSEIIGDPCGATGSSPRERFAPPLAPPGTGSFSLPSFS